MAQFKVEFASPKLIAQDGEVWVTHHVVSHRTVKGAQSAARVDAQVLRGYHVKVRVTREI